MGWYELVPYLWAIEIDGIWDLPWNIGLTYPRCSMVLEYLPEH